MLRSGQDTFMEMSEKHQVANVGFQSIVPKGLSYIFWGVVECCLYKGIPRTTRVNAMSSTTSTSSTRMTKVILKVIQSQSVSEQNSEAILPSESHWQLLAPFTSLPVWRQQCFPINVAVKSGSLTSNLLLSPEGNRTGGHERGLLCPD